MSGIYKTVRGALSSIEKRRARDTIFYGDSLDLVRNLPARSIDLIFSSPPYCMGKEYERSSSVDDFAANHRVFLPELVRVLRPGGSICWQVGYHISPVQVTPLDFIAHEIFSGLGELRLKNRIVWTFAHGLHAKKRFSGRHEVVLWYTKGEASFDLNSIRVPQKYPGKKAYRGPNKGKYSGNPLGKNPGDVWNVPNVKGFHVEKTNHPCQFPVALPLVFVKALCPAKGIVFDPFMGVGSTGVAAAMEGRRFVGAEIVREYAETALRRILEARNGRAVYRSMEQPIHEPRPTDAVARKPAHFRG